MLFKFFLTVCFRPCSSNIFMASAISLLSMVIPSCSRHEAMLLYYCKYLFQEKIFIWNKSGLSFLNFIIFGHSLAAGVWENGTDRNVFVLDENNILESNQ